MTASPSVLCSRFSPSSNFVNGHVSTTWFMVLVNEMQQVTSVGVASIKVLNTSSRCPDTKLKGVLPQMHSTDNSAVYWVIAACEHNT